MEQGGGWATMHPLPLTWCKYLPSVSWISQPRDDWSVFGEHLSYWHPQANCVRQPDKIKSLDTKFLPPPADKRTAELQGREIRHTVGPRLYYVAMLFIPIHHWHCSYFIDSAAWGASVGFPSLAGSRDKGMCQNKRIRSSSVWGTHGRLKEAQSIHTE